jgi:protein TonB
MSRGSKIALGVAAALALHLLLFLLFSPRLDGLAGAGSAAPPAAAPEEAAVAPSDLPVFEPTPETEPLDIAWPEEEEPPPAKPRKSTTKRRDPSANDVSDTAASMGATPILSADATYAQRVRQHLAAYAGALPPGASGEARVQFVVQPDGRVSNVQLVKRSGHAALDAMALSLPQQAQPLPLPGPLPQRLEVPLQAVAAGS